MNTGMFKLLESLRESYNLYIDKPSLIDLKHYTNGYRDGINAVLYGICNNLIQLDSLSDYITKHFGFNDLNTYITRYYGLEPLETSKTGYALIMEDVKDDEKAFYKFFELLDDFLKQ